jgi:phosphoenolpyruvate---glycerone phosphotransferase subunit DhaL
MSDSVLRACILAAADALEAARDELCRLDAVAGDGDHGVTMALAARAVRQKLGESPDATAADLLLRVAQGAGSVGGAIGPIYATALIRAAATLRALAAAETGATVSEPTVARLRVCAQAAADGITAIGHATPGDKTIVDALAPAVAALADAEGRGATVGEALEAAVAAARRGAESTTDMVATVGRASRLGERGRGSPDPGASSLVVILEAAVRAYGRWAAGTGNPPAGAGEG